MEWPPLPSLPRPPPRYKKSLSCSVCLKYAANGCRFLDPLGTLLRTDLQRKPPCLLPQPQIRQTQATVQQAPLAVHQFYSQLTQSLLPRYTCTQTYTHTLRCACTHRHRCTPPCAHARTHARAHTHTRYTWSWMSSQRLCRQAVST